MRYTKIMPCTEINKVSPECPKGWTSVGYTKPGSCFIGNVPGNGPKDTWGVYGYNRVCKKNVPSSGDMALDCCSNLYDIGDSVECKTREYLPYSSRCNNVMKNRCKHSQQKNTYAPEWNGMPYGMKPVVYNECTGQIRGMNKPFSGHEIDQYCLNYLRKAPPNNFYHNHDYQDYPYHFPRHSYTTPNFNGTWGYQPIRVPYKPYHEYENKNTSNYCEMYPNDCLSYQHSTSQF